MSNPQNLSNNKNLSELIKQQRENELDQMERLEDMQEQAQANALKQIEELNKKQAEETIKQRAFRNLGISVTEFSQVGCPIKTIRLKSTPDRSEILWKISYNPLSLMIKRKQSF